MKKLYITSNYNTQLYELDENNFCICEDKTKISIEDAIAKFKTNRSVQVFGIIKAQTQEFVEGSGWKVLKKIVPKENIIEEIRKKISLKSKIFVSLQMDDYDNWENGIYKGDVNKIIRQAESILDDVFDWIDCGMPGGKDKDLSSRKK